MKKEESLLISKLLLILIKYIPIVQMLVMILNNILSYLNIDNKVLYLFDFTTGNSLLFIMLMYLLSIKLGYCKWHRYLITGNLINLFVVILDSIYFIPINDIFILLFYCTIGCISIIAATYSHIKDIKHETRLKIDKASSCRND